MVWHINKGVLDRQIWHTFCVHRKPNKRTCGVVSLYGTSGVCNKEVHLNSENFNDWLGHKSFSLGHTREETFPLEPEAVPTPRQAPWTPQCPFSHQTPWKEKTAPTTSENPSVSFDNGSGRAGETCNKHRGGIIDVLKVLVSHETRQLRSPD